MRNQFRKSIFVVSVSIMLSISFLQSSNAVVFERNPFYSMSDAEIHRVKGYTPDGILLIELEYSPDKIQKGQHVFFKINVLNKYNNQKTRHVDNDLIIRDNKSDIFKASDEYGEQLIHATNRITLTQFNFNQTGEYTVSVLVGGLNFFPIKPLAVNFTTIVTDTSDGSLHVVLSS